MLTSKCATSSLQTGLLQSVLTDLLNSYPALIVDFVCFTDDKLFEFYHCKHKERPKRSLSHTYGDSLTLTPFSRTPLARWLSLWIARFLISCPQAGNTVIPYGRWRSVAMRRVSFWRAKLISPWHLTMIVICHSADEWRQINSDVWSMISNQ